MPSLIALIVFTLSCSSILSLALNLPRVALDPNLKCQNRPYIYYPAGTLLPPDKGDALEKNDPDPPYDPESVRVLCAPGSETFIKMTRKFPTIDLMVEKNSTETQDQLYSLLGNTFTWIKRERLDDLSRADAVIHPEKDLEMIVRRASPDGRYQLQVFNAHQDVIHHRWGGHGTKRIVGNEVTWHVLFSALGALIEYMTTNPYGWGQCYFEIWDGKIQVGWAKVAPRPHIDGF